MTRFKVLITEANTTVTLYIDECLKVDWGDGNITESESSPYHTYSTAGAYEILLTMPTDNEVLGMGGGAEIFQDNDTILQEVVIGEEITTIEDYAFYGCENLHTVIIPQNNYSSQLSIETSAFESCANLKNIYIYQDNVNIPEVGNDVFPSTCNIYLPNDNVSDYKDAWTDYASLIKSGDLVLKLIENALICKSKLDVKIEGVQNADGTSFVSNKIATIPDATASVKGLATLPKDFELIEKIIIGYSVLTYEPDGYILLTAEPSDWSTNYTDYFTRTNNTPPYTYANVTGETAPTFTTNKYYQYDSTKTWANNYTSYYKTNGYARNNVNFGYTNLTALETWESGKYYSYTAGNYTLNRSTDTSGNAYNFKKCAMLVHNCSNSVLAFRIEGYYVGGANLLRYVRNISNVAFMYYENFNNKFFISLNATYSRDSQYNQPSYQFINIGNGEDFYVNRNIRNNLNVGTIGISDYAPISAGSVVYIFAVRS